MPVGSAIGAWTERGDDRWVAFLDGHVERIDARDWLDAWRAHLAIVSAASGPAAQAHARE
jgi:hypothetical protein